VIIVTTLVDRDKLIQGILIAGFAILLQRFLEQPYWQVLTKLDESITRGDSGRLIIAASFMVGLNALRALPVYVGAFRAVEGVDSKQKPMAILVAGSIISLTFTLLYLLEQGQWEWGVPLAVFLGASGLFLLWGRGVLKFWHKVIIIGQLLLGSYWLAIAPVLTPVGFGAGELSTGIKLAGQFLNAESTLNFVSVAFFLPLITIAIVTTGLIDNYQKIIQQINERKKRENQMQRVQLAAAEARVLQEMHALVHDLKTPLTTIRGLNSLIEMTAANDKQAEYAGRIEIAAENMNGMISEILYEDVREPITIHSLINYVRAQIIPEELEQRFHFDVGQDMPKISVNKVRLARALVNVIDNAVRATRQNVAGRVDILAVRNNGGVEFSIKDNGDGMSEKELDMIWQPGYSSRNSSGLGLTFVRKVVENHGGSIEIDSQPDKGTVVRITIPDGRGDGHD